MEFTVETLSHHLVLTATLPGDNMNVLENLIKWHPALRGIGVLPASIEIARLLVEKQETLKLIGLVGYPTGGVSLKTKVNEIRDMNIAGADAYHVVVNSWNILSGNWGDVQWELLTIHNTAGRRPVSLIMEAAYLSDHQIMRLVNLCVEVGIQSIATSTGWLPKNPDLEQFLRIKEMVYGRIPIMVTGVFNLEQAEEVFEAGADTIVIPYQAAETIFSQFDY